MKLLIATILTASQAVLQISASCGTKSRFKCPEQITHDTPFGTAMTTQIETDDCSQCPQSKFPSVLVGDQDSKQCIERDVLGRSHGINDFFGLIIWTIGAGLAMAAGVGGGGIFVPLGVLLLRFGAKAATGLSQASIFGASLGGLVINTRNRHPIADRPVIDLDVALFLAPMEMAGAILGVIVQSFLPEWAVIVLMAIILGYTSYRTFNKGKEVRNKERLAKEKAAREETDGKAGQTSNPGAGKEAITNQENFDGGNFSDGNSSEDLSIFSKAGAEIDTTKPSTSLQLSSHHLSSERDNSHPFNANGVADAKNELAEAGKRLAGVIGGSDLHRFDSKESRSFTNQTNLEFHKISPSSLNFDRPEILDNESEWESVASKGSKETPDDENGKEGKHNDAAMKKDSISTQSTIQSSASMARNEYASNSDLKSSIGKKTGSPTTSTTKKSGSADRKKTTSPIRSPPMKPPKTVSISTDVKAAEVGKADGGTEKDHTTCGNSCGSADDDIPGLLKTKTASKISRGSRDSKQSSDQNEVTTYRSDGTEENKFLSLVSSRETSKSSSSVSLFDSTAGSVYAARSSELGNKSLTGRSKGINIVDGRHTKMVSTVDAESTADGEPIGRKSTAVFGADTDDGILHEEDIPFRYDTQKPVPFRSTSEDRMSVQTVRSKDTNGNGFNPKCYIGKGAILPCGVDINFDSPAGGDETNNCYNSMVRAVAQEKSKSAFIEALKTSANPAVDEKFGANSSDVHEVNDRHEKLGCCGLSPKKKIGTNFGLKSNWIFNRKSGKTPEPMQTEIEIESLEVGWAEENYAPADELMQTCMSYSDCLGKNPMAVVQYRQGEYNAQNGCHDPLLRTCRENAEDDTFREEGEDEEIFRDMDFFPRHVKMSGWKGDYCFTEGKSCAECNIPGENDFAEEDSAERPWRSGEQDEEKEEDPHQSSRQQDLYQTEHHRPLEKLPSRQQDLYEMEHHRPAHDWESISYCDDFPVVAGDDHKVNQLENPEKHPQRVNSGKQWQTGEALSEQAIVEAHSLSNVYRSSRPNFEGFHWNELLTPVDGDAEVSQRPLDQDTETTRKTCSERARRDSLILRQDAQTNRTNEDAPLDEDAQTNRKVVLRTRRDNLILRATGNPRDKVDRINGTTASSVMHRAVGSVQAPKEVPFATTIGGQVEGIPAIKSIKTGVWLDVKTRPAKTGEDEPDVKTRLASTVGGFTVKRSIGSKTLPKNKSVTFGPLQPEKRNSLRKMVAVFVQNKEKEHQQQTDVRREQKKLEAFNEGKHADAEGGEGDAGENGEDSIDFHSDYDENVLPGSRNPSVGMGHDSMGDTRVVGKEPNEDDTNPEHAIANTSHASKPEDPDRPSERVPTLKPRQSISRTLFQVKRPNRLHSKEEWLEADAESPKRQYMYLVILWIVLLFLLLLKGGKGAKSIIPDVIVHCEGGYWAITLLGFVWLFGFGSIMARRAVNKSLRKQRVDFPFVEGDVKWTWPKIKFYSFWTFMAGVVAGLIGIGGGMVLGPLMLQMGVLPQVSTATTATMIVLTSSSVAFLFVMGGLVPIDYAIIFFLVAFCGALVGKTYIDKEVKKRNAASILIFLLAAIIFFAASMVTIAGVMMYSERDWCFEGLKEICK